jgi:hypothetical protein
MAISTSGYTNKVCQKWELYYDAIRVRDVLQRNCGELIRICKLPACVTTIGGRKENIGKGTCITF